MTPKGAPANIGNGSGVTQAPAGAIVKVDLTHSNAPPGNVVKAKASGIGVVIKSL
jgi:hypothetical protein